MLEPAILALLIPITCLMIPIVAILTAHQRKMAEIIHQKASTQPGEIEALRREIYELKQLVHQQAIAMDSLLVRQTPPPTSPDISQRLDV
jgi:hypothetical protein